MQGQQNVKKKKSCSLFLRMCVCVCVYVCVYDRICNAMCTGLYHILYIETACKVAKNISENQ